MIRIREVQLTERVVEDLNWMDTLAFPGLDPYPKAGALWWIGYDEKTCGCFAGLKNVGHDTGFLCRVAVLKAYRGIGLHRRLIKVREKKAREIGLRWLITYTHPLNLKSANNLIECGFKMYQPQNPYGMEDALYFRKAL